MNTRLLTLFLLGCPFANSVFAQQQPETAPVSDAQKTRYYNTVEYVNCKIAQYSVQNTKDAVLQADFIKSCNCNADGGTDANLQRFFSTHKLGKNAKIFKMTDSLKLSYKAGMNGTQLSDLITGYLASSKLADFASNKPTFPDFTKQLSVEIDNRFIGITNNTVTPPATSGETSAAPDPIQNATETSDSAIAKFFNYFIVFLLGVLGGAVALRFWQQTKAKERKNQRGEGENLAPNSPNSQVLEQQITALQRELENQKKLNTQLKMRLDDAFITASRPEPPRTAASFVTPPIDDDVEEIQDSPENIVDFDDIQIVDNDEISQPSNPKKENFVDFEIENTTVPTVVETPETPVQSIGSRIFFLRLPTKDGLFNDLRKSDIFRPAESVYRMELVDKIYARFAIVPDEETMHRAIQGFAIYLEPACEIVGTLDTNAVLIKTIEEGIAVKEGDVWRITQKAVIDLI